MRFPFAALLVLLLGVVCAPFADAEEDSWVALEEESAPEAPLLRATAGILLWIEVRSRVRSDRLGIPGSRLEDLEGGQGLESAGAAPWAEISVGDKVRGGVDGSYFARPGQFEFQEEDVIFNGELMATEGELLKSSFEFLSLGGFVQWDLLYGETYRIGLLGGLRYFRLDVDIRSVRIRAPRALSERTRGELLSPFFGGLVELVPFPYLTVYTRFEFMNWSWEEIGLKEARYFEVRLGVKLNPLPETLSIGVDYRFMVVRAEATAGRSSRSRLEAGLAASGMAVTLEVRF